MGKRKWFHWTLVIFGVFSWTLPGAAEPDAAKALAYATVERNAEQIATIGDSVYYFGELGMQEFESAKFVKQVLESIGFTVETGAAGMPTTSGLTGGPASHRSLSSRKWMRFRAVRRPREASSASL